jgi:hypothetical protein
MSCDRAISRREAITVISSVCLSSVTGCSTLPLVGGDGTSKNPDSTPPTPVILSAAAEVGNFRQTSSMSQTIFLLKNKGDIGEFTVTVKARGEAAIYDKTSETFSLKHNQEYQAGFELFTHEGAIDIIIIATPTKFPNRSTRLVINENRTPDMINYESN